MDNEEFMGELGFDPTRTSPVIAEGFFGNTLYKNTSNFLKALGLRIVISGLVGLLGAAAINNHQEVKKLDRQPVADYIDTDALSDLVIGDRIFLADVTEDGISYRRLTSSDRYRVR